MTLDDLDRRILQMVQSEFPIASRPFQALAASVGHSENEVIARMRRLQESGVIREVGPVFSLHKLGYTSTLCAAQVEEDSVAPVAAVLNALPEVTHNYLRNDPFNMWFTLIAPSQGRIETILEAIRREEGVGEVLSLPAERMFKINVQFDTAKESE
jgi:DNA-binding Lrp family transcriptional regulator